MKVFFLLLIVLIASTLAACPNNCNNHGTCSNNRCRCNRFYYGDDCSIWRDTLENGYPKTGSVERFEWRFYNFTLNAGEGFSLQVDQASARADIDVYIQKNGFPDFTSHIMEETSTDQSFSLSLDTPVTETTIFYVGVFGFSSGTSEFTLSLTVTGACRDNCNRHGRCSRGVCICHTGFTGEFCENSVNAISIGQTYSNIRVPENEWLFYTYNLNTASNMNLHISQVSGDVDIYVRFGENPTWFEYQYVDSSTDTDINLLIDAPQVGKWYFGFYGYQESVFSFTLTKTTECPDKCSNHGTCSGSHCVCNSGFTGRACETMTAALTNGVSVNGYVAKNGWNYYNYASNSANSFAIELTQLEADMDCDLYVNRGEVPTLSNYLFSDISTENVAHLRIDDAGSATWYIGVFGYEKCDYNLKAFETTGCPGGCGNHGTCNANGRCVCNTGYVGANCETRSGNFINGNTLTGQFVEQNQWKYYTITVENSSQMNIVAKETSTTGMIWLFVSAGQYPTLADHEEDDTETQSSVHRISLEWTTPRSGVTYYIGVYGSPFALREIEFSLSIFYTPF